jgi:radical SAM superfamily enzyme YgiQ (UPF0313 family)
VSCTKAETVKPEHIPVYARAGCRYLSISPESGSPAVMKAIGKPFDYAHGEALVRACTAHGVYTQACFLVGHPAETGADFAQSVAYLERLVRSGLDEVAVFVVALAAEAGCIATRRFPSSPVRASSASRRRAGGTGRKCRAAAAV